jgi:hypothetical protein
MRQIVLVSGLQVPALIWDKTARGLAEKGFRVLIYGMTPYTKFHLP